MKKVIFTIILFQFVSMLLANKRVSLPEVFRPQKIAVNGNRLYIAETGSILIYNLENVKFLKRFGKRGEGPGEIQLIQNIFLKKDQLVVNSMKKILLFSVNGDYIGEKRLSKVFTRYIYPIKDNYVGAYIAGDLRGDGKVYYRIAFLDARLNQIKTLAERELPRKGKTTGRLKTDAVKDFFKPRFYEDRVYIGDTWKGFYIEVFSNNGERIYTINKKYEKIKITDEQIKNILRWKKKEDGFFTSLTGREIKYNFREYFPAYKDFTVQDDKIYVFTYKTNNERQEVIIMDLDGKELGKAFATIAKINAIANGKYYYLKDNLDKEEWELYWEELH